MKLCPTPRKAQFMHIRIPRITALKYINDRYINDEYIYIDGNLLWNHINKRER